MVERHETSQSEIAKTPISEEQAKRIVELYQLKLSNHAPASSVTLGDIAEALDVPVDEAADLLEQTRAVASPVKQRPERRTLLPVLLIILAMTILTVVVWASSARATNQGASAEAIADDSWSHSRFPAPTNTPPSVTVSSDPLTASSDQPLEDPRLQGFTVEVSYSDQGETWPARPKPFELIQQEDQVRLKKDVERAVVNLAQEVFNSAADMLPPSELGIQSTVTISTIAGKTTFKVRSYPSAFPLDDKNPSTQKLKADIHNGVKNGWKQLVPPR